MRINNLRKYDEKLLNNDADILSEFYVDYYHHSWNNGHPITSVQRNTDVAI